ncbi:AAA family ATPase [Microbacterium sp. M1A1_1b]
MTLATSAAPRTPTLTLFCGLPGAGKTTLARRLEAAGVGVRIATDEWQAAIGIPHADADFHEALQVVLYRHALTLLRAGVDVVLEDGLWTAAERQQKFADARACGARIRFHVFDVDHDTLWERLRERNAAAAPGSAPLTEDDLRWAEGVFEPVTATELALVDEYVRHTGGTGPADGVPRSPR